MDEKNRKSTVEEQEKDMFGKIVLGIKGTDEIGFAKFTTISVTFLTILFWMIKGIWYAYQAGKFSVYGIDICYINTSDESILLQIIQTVAAAVVLGSTNYLFFKIATSKDDSKFHWKKIRGILGFWIVEMILLFAMVMVMSDTNIVDIFRGETLQNILLSLLLLALTCLMINAYGIWYAITLPSKEELKSGKESDAENQSGNGENKVKKNREIVFIIVLVVTAAAEMMLMYFWGVQSEYDRTDYKLIMIGEESDSESKYVFKSKNGDEKYIIYPIIFENTDCYIVTQLYKEKGEIKMDYAYQKIIEKQGVDTYRTDNIYRIDVE